MGKVSELDTIGAGLYRGHNGEKLDTMMVVAASHRSAQERKCIEIDWSKGYSASALKG